MPSLMMFSTLCAGSSILLLVQIRFNLDAKPPPPKQSTMHKRQRSEDLIEYLEMQLGSSRVSYMDIRVCFSHSAFPDFSNPDTVTGVASLRTRMETMATANLKRHNVLSPWSPPPAPAPNPLFQLIERHWGMEKAAGAMQQILEQRSTPRRPARSKSTLSADSQDRDDNKGNTVMPPEVPKRRTSLQRDFPGGESEVHKGPIPGERHKLQENIPTSSCCRSSKALCKSHGEESRLGISRNEPRRRDNTSIVHVNKRRSLGVEALRSMVPMLSDSTTGSQDTGEGRSLRGATVRARGKRDSGIWNWGNWF